MLLSILLNAPPPYDPLRDPIWQFVGVIAAIIVGVVAIILAYLSIRQQRRRKEMTYQIISDAPVVSVNKTVRNRVKILLDGKEVKDARLLVLKVWNSGNAAIKDDDYFEQIMFKFNGGTLIGSDILETNPQNLIDPNFVKTFLTQKTDAIELPKFPFNPNDAISLTALLTGESKVSIKGRIAEGRIINYNTANNSYAKTFGIQLFILVIFTIILSVSSYINISSNIYYKVILTIVALGLFAISTYIMINQSVNTRRRKINKSTYN